MNTAGSKHHILIAAMLIASAVCLSVLLTWHNNRPFTYYVGKPWLYQNLTASMSFKVPRDTAAVIDSINANFMKVYTRDDNVGKAALARLSQAMTVAGIVDAATRHQAMSALEALYRSGIVPDSVAEDMHRRSVSQAHLSDDVNKAVLTRIDIKNLRSQTAAAEWLSNALESSPSSDRFVQLTLDNFVVANITPDSLRNSEEYERDLKTALDNQEEIQKGEAIISTGAIVSPRTKYVIDTYMTILFNQGKHKRQDGNDIMSKYYTKGGRVMLLCVMLVMFLVFMLLARPAIYANMRLMSFLICFVTVFSAVVYLLTNLRAGYIYLVPFALVPIIVNTFVDRRTSFFTHMLVVMLCSLVAEPQADFIIMQFVAGVIALASLRELTRRSQLARAAVFIFFGYGVTYTALMLSHSLRLDEILSDWHFFMFFAINSLVLSFAYMGIFIAEKVFGFTSTVTLIELADINTPLLRELSENCPGTFQHVLQVANIASEAALKLQANEALVRAGAMYHDIGKLSNPAFFTENQTGVNPHDALAPEQSARIVVQHVADGLRMADKAHLPQVIKDMIAQHHGKGMAKYFYTQACKAHPDVEVDKAPFTYPGPNPQTREAAILMMADACEAAAKSLSDHSETAIASLVERIIDGQMADGLFKEAPITFRDVEAVKKIFTKRLSSIYHTRISYPTALMGGAQSATAPGENGAATSGVNS